MILNTWENAYVWIGPSIDEQEINSPVLNATAPVERARSEMNGAMIVPTQRRGANNVTKINIRMMLPPVTRKAATAIALFTIPANGRISFPGKNIENNNVTGDSPEYC